MVLQCFFQVEDEIMRVVTVVHPMFQRAEVDIGTVGARFVQY